MGLAGPVGSVGPVGKGWKADPHVSTCLQEMDNLIHSNLADIVVELLMTLYEGGGTEGDLQRFIG